ncbi:MAG: SRPBCC family protein [Sphingobium phenoxybenzoativorans]
MTDASLDLTITRYIAAPPETVYKVWTERTEEWFAPKPWTAKLLEQDLRPGGRSALTMTGPDGVETPPMEGVVLEVIPNRKIVTTDAFSAGWVPQGPFMTAITTFEPEGEGTRYTATARHWTEEAMKQHEEMGFTTGWSQVADQLAALCEAVDA